MSNCDACAANKNCKSIKSHGSSSFYRKDSDTPVIALLGQPNAGKSTIFNMMTGSHQHVGNWPGKTVDQKEGEFRWNGKRMILADLPGSYSLSAGSDEEVITRDYISSGNADLVLVLADASQLKRSLYMLADFVGTQVPAILVLNMMDVAKGQGMAIDTELLSDKLGIPVVPMSAIQKKDYQFLYSTIADSLNSKPIVHGDTISSARDKLAFIDNLLEGVVKASKMQEQAYSRFDRLALSPVRGKLLAFGIILGIFLLAMIFSGIISGIASAALTPAASGLRSLLNHAGVHPLLSSLVCDVLVNVLYFAVMMASFVLGITLGFNLMEETGYLARISFLFDHTMSKVGLQGKTIMPFFMGLGCTIALFGSTGGFLVIISIFLFMFLMMWLVYKIFGNTLSPKDERVGLIMELPPYHKPNIRNTLYVTFQRTLDIFWRALKVISLVSIVFFVLTYGFGAKTAGSSSDISSILAANFTRAEGLAFIFAISFNMPCISALAATSRETHSVKWTAKIGVFYTVAALIISCIVYHIGLLVF